MTVQVYETANFNSQPLMRECGRGTTEEVRSSTNQMFIRMVSDRSRSYRGFNATYSTGEIIEIMYSLTWSFLYHISGFRSLYL